VFAVARHSDERLIRGHESSKWWVELADEADREQNPDG
jgi:hypothetical protein